MMASSRMKNEAMLSAVCLVLMLAQVPSAHAFSAGLPRPWDHLGYGDGGSNGNGRYSRFRTLRKRNRSQRRHVVDASGTKKSGETTTHATSINHDNEDGVATSDDDRQTDDSTISSTDEDESEDEERMVLEDPPRVFLAPSSGAGAAVTPHAAAAAHAGSKAIGTHQQPTVRSCLPQLFVMARPSNFAGVVLLHMLGTHLGLRALIDGFSATPHTLRSVLVNPQMMVVLLALILTSSTSMIVNDYYDARSGVDAGKVHKPMVNGSVPLPVVKRFCSYLYAALLVCVTMIPGMVARLSIITGAMLTFWYTQHLKPLTWIKNVTCATLIALSPFCSGAAALQLLSKDAWSIFRVSSIWRLFGMLIFGFIGREIFMDMNDVVEDRRHRVRTVPAHYGRLFAARVAFGCTIAMAALSVLGTTDRRQVILALFGSIAQLYRAFQVLRTGGQNEKVTERAVEEGKQTVLFLLASFV